jgi:hypothetical protein
MIKSRLAVIPDDETPKADRGPAFPIPEDITIRLQDVERVKFDDLDDSKAKDKGDKVPCEWVEPANGTISIQSKTCFLASQLRVSPRRIRASRSFVLPWR